MKGILVSLLLMCSGITSAQWVVIDTFALQLTNPNYDVSLRVRFINDGTIAYSYTADPPTPSTEADMRVYKTTNDGISWGNILSYFDYSYEDYDLQFPNADTGFISYNYMSHVTIERTTNGGQSWEFITGFGPSSMFFINGQYGYGSDGPVFMRYENNSFIDIDTLSFLPLNQKIFFTKNMIGYRIYSIGYNQPRRYLIRTLDNGESWDVVLDNDIRRFYDIVAPSDSVCYIACDSGYMYKTVDIGENWTILNLNTNANVLSISFLDDANGYALCSNKIVYKTDDGGNSWLYQTLPSNIATVFSIRMINENVGYIYAEDTQTSPLEIRVLIKTENGGFTGLAKKNENKNIIKTYPNPFNNHLNVELESEYEEIEICDLNGLTVYSQKLTQNNNQILKIELGNLDSGIYFLKIKTSDNYLIRKLIKL